MTFGSGGNEVTCILGRFSSIHVSIKQNLLRNLHVLNTACIWLPSYIYAYHVIRVHHAMVRKRETGLLLLYYYIEMPLFLNSSPSMSCVDGKGSLTFFGFVFDLFSAQNKMTVTLFYISFTKFQRQTLVIGKIIYPEQFRVRRDSTCSNLKLRSWEVQWFA